jgi:hypothetical protein
MSFASAVTSKTVFGNKRVNFGTFTNGASDTGGDINTGLRSCEEIFLQHVSSAVVASAPSVNETLPVAGSAVTIVTTAGADGRWMAIGY